MSEALLKVNEISIAFGGVVAADKVSFELNSGEIKGLIGPNGAGKTTILNLISGIYSVDSGNVYIDGQDVTKVPSHKRARLGLARTFQSPCFVHRSSILNNLLLGTDLSKQEGYLKSFFKKNDEKHFKEELDELLEIAGLSVDLNEAISSLSFGQQKILEIVRAMLEHPKIILIDEPAAGLNDVELQRVMKLMEHAANLGCGIILIEHRMDMVMNFCHNILVLNFGKVIAEGTPEEVQSNEAVIEAYLGRDS